MTDPRPRRPQATIPASQRQAPPFEDPTPTGPIPIAPPPAPARADPPAPDVEWPSCWDCGWLLHTSIAGDLWCPHWACAQYRRPVGTLVADREANDLLRTAIDMANGEQHRDHAQEPPRH